MRNLKTMGTVKKTIALLTLALTFISCIQPTTAKANSFYQPRNGDNMLGAAADFGIFIKNTARTTAHSDSNIACGQLDLSSGSITASTSDAINFAGEIIGNGRIDKGYLYVGIGKVIKPYAKGNDQHWRVGKYYVAENTSDFKRVILAPAYVDLTAEFTKLENLAATLKTYPTQNATIYNGDAGGNGKSITCTSNYSVLNLKAADLTGETRDLKITNIRGDKLLIVNVDMSGYQGKTFTFDRRILLDGATGDFDLDATNIIWNFSDFNGNIETSAVTAGVILAPRAAVMIKGGNHIGIVIADSFSNKSEVHFVPFNHFTSVQVGILSVDGNPCPSTPLGGTSFAVYTTDGVLVEGTKKTVSADTEGNFTADWTINKVGKYYIQETKTVPGFTLTPVKARFDVTNEDGILKVKMISGKEAKGYTSAIRNGKFLIRHYSNEVCAVGINIIDETNYDVLQNTSFTLYKSNSDPTDLTCLKVVTQGYCNADGFAIMNILDPGYYCLTQTSTQDGYITSTEVKKFAVYMTPIGHLLTVELDNTTGIEILSILKKYLGDNMKMTVLSAKMNKELIAYGYRNGEMTLEYNVATDQCVIFPNGK